MEWPKKLWFIRHGRSKYNAHREHKEADSEYRLFLSEFENDWQSAETKRLAGIMWKRYALEFGDWNTPLTEESVQQALTVGKELRHAVELPDVLFVSPHDRTWQTLNDLMEGWPKLSSVKIVEEPRLHEQDHGLATVYNDWHIFHALEPIQKMHYDKAGPY